MLYYWHAPLNCNCIVCTIVFFMCIFFSYILQSLLPGLLSTCSPRRGTFSLSWKERLRPLQQNLPLTVPSLQLSTRPNPQSLTQVPLGEESPLLSPFPGTACLSVCIYLPQHSSLIPNEEKVYMYKTVLTASSEYTRLCTLYLSYLNSKSCSYYIRRTEKIFLYNVFIPSHSYQPKLS